MTDPMDALIGLQSALEGEAVRISPCKLHPELGVLLDHPAGKPRFTYALAKSGQVLAIALFVLVEPINETPCFHIGYAVIESSRNKGVGSLILEHAIEELRYGLSRTPMKEFYLEAIVSTDNVSSNRVAHKLISDAPEVGNDCFSGEPIFQYLRKVQCLA